ncbi:MAG: T9SS type A sorting domain-containing protein, partial [Prolixibacteraceae bacterium]
KWQSAVSPFSSWNDIANTASTYTSGALTQTTHFRAVLQSGECSSDVSEVAVITVDPLSGGGKIAGSTSVISGPNNTNLTLSGYTGYIVKWQSSTDDWVSYTNIANSSTTLTAINLTNTTRYRAMVQSGVCFSTYSADAVISVDPLSVGGSIDGSATVAYGINSTTFSLNGQTGTVIKWQSSSDNWVTFTDIDNTSTSLTAFNLTTTTMYRAVVKSGVSPSVISAEAIVVVSPLSVGGSIAGGKTVCAGTDNILLTLSGQTGSVLKWQSAVAPFYSWSDIASTATSYTSRALTQTTRFRAVVQSGQNTSSESEMATIIADRVSVGGITEGSSTVCEGINSTLLKLSGQYGSVVKWQRSSDNWISASDIDNTSTSLIANNLNISTRYRAIVQNGVCSGSYSSEATVGVNFKSVPSISGPAEVCEKTSGVTYDTEPDKTDYSWSVSAGGTITAGAGTRAISVSWDSPGMQSVSVEYTDTNGCGVTVETHQNITVYPLPAPVITGLSAVSIGSTGTTFTTAAAMSHYEWTVSGGYATSSRSLESENNITVMWTSAGSNTVSVKFTTPFGCSSGLAGTKTVTVAPLPVPQIKGNASACINSGMQNYTTEPGMSNYSWSVSDGGAITSGLGTYAIRVGWITPGEKTVSVNYTDSLGGRATQASSRKILVYPEPIPTIAGPDAVGEKSKGITYATENGMTNYLWNISPGGAITSGAGTGTIVGTWNTVGPQQISVTYTNANGCAATSPSTKQVYVYPLPGTPEKIFGPTEVCAGSSSIVYAVAPAENATGYVWSLPHGATFNTGQGSSIVSVNFAPGTVSGNVSVYGSNAYGNGSSVALTIHVAPLPEAAGPVSGPAAVCQGTSGVTYSVPAIRDATDYHWVVPSGATITEGANFNVITVDFAAGAASGIVSVYGLNICGKGAASQPFSVTLNPVPATPAIIAERTLLNSSAAFGNKWFFSTVADQAGSLIPGASGQYYAPTQDGWYAANVTVNGCTSEVSNQLFRIIPGEKNIYNVYPIPNDGDFTISIITPDEQYFNLSIYNLLGQKVYELNNLQVNGLYKEIINLSPVSAGLYTIVLKARDEIKLWKMIINQ